MTGVTSCLKPAESPSDWHSPPRIYILLAIFQAQTQRRIPIARGYHGEDVPYKTLYIYIATTARDCPYSINLASCTTVRNGLACGFHQIMGFFRLSIVSSAFLMTLIS
ncbi:MULTISPECIES: hypothetical protein [unclassified Microcoleus]|uniref:hypothetical protein n=1 Tax=unclassified Microcoleus TaxID=2642155 RepID=UPI001D7F5B79|nr:MULTISPECIES: hypothetical protein [unclassified Microcoleus]MCC3512908.1 hypothetical protein [Microcoleus sp. PH2017_17_BER_D_A]TAE52071.1 MAG: hypothetical protein EAZ88_16360 [Oscillatoriales cyanobacterium]TAE66461.1 MAG: hypothetical protein EAZ86_20440 [Oscillatoriales cyanobacterium]